ncbi:MAG: hypothetical protein M1824_003045 [Vezdaea acicularis]|nr:MAG: hypothetical protein M1824_003045 [Vezdaea acicularis]
MPQRIIDDLRGLRQRFINEIRKMIEGYWIQLEIEPDVSNLPRVWCEECGKWRQRYDITPGYVNCPRCMTPLTHLATCHRELRQFNLRAWLETRRLWPYEVLEVQSADWIVEIAAIDFWITDGLHASAEQDDCLYPRIISEIPMAFQDHLHRHELMGLKLGDYTWRV